MQDRGCLIPRFGRSFFQGTHHNRIHVILHVIIIVHLVELVNNHQATCHVITCFKRLGRTIVWILEILLDILQIRTTFIRNKGLHVVQILSPLLFRHSLQAGNDRLPVIHHFRQRNIFPIHLGNGLIQVVQQLSLRVSVIQYLQYCRIQHVPREPVFPVRLEILHGIHTLLTTQLYHLVNRVQRLIVKRSYFRFIYPLSPELGLELVIILVSRVTNLLKNIINLVRICQCQRASVLECQSILF